MVFVGVGMTVKIKVNVFLNTARTDYEREYIYDVIVPGFSSNDDFHVSNKDYEPCDVAFIMYSTRKGSEKTTRAARFIRNNHGINLLIFEMPIFRETEVWHSRFGFDHVHRGGRFSEEVCPSDRLEKLNLEIKPWNIDGSNVIIAAQINDDYSLDGIDAFQWACDVASFLKRNTNLNIVIRPHPLDLINNWDQFSLIHGVEISRYSLNYDLGRAKCWISYTSGSSVDAVVAGVPVICLSQNNFCWDISRHSISEIENPFLGNRIPTLSRLAYSQWSREEIASGEAWGNLKKFLLPK